MRLTDSLPLRSQFDDVADCEGRNETSNHDARRNGDPNERPHASFSLPLDHLGCLDCAQGRHVAIWEGKQAIVQHLEPVWVPQTHWAHLERRQEESAKENCA